MQCLNASPERSDRERRTHRTQGANAPNARHAKVFNNPRLNQAVVVPCMREWLLVIDKFDGVIESELLKVIFMEGCRFMVPLA